MEPNDLAKLYESLDRNVDALYASDSVADLPEQLSDEASGRYQTRELLGRGGSKAVYLAFDRALEREVALATPLDDATAAQIADFQREARLTASLNHPNVISIYDIGSLPDGRPYFTMSLLIGRSLTDEINAGAGKGLLQALSKVCDAIAYAHDCGVVHLDLKPDNVQIGSFGEVLVCDWGIARYLGDSQPVPVPATVKAVVGTPAYMSPEQARGELVDARTDVYALGAILYATLVGAAPRAGMGQVTAITAAGAAAPVPPPNELDDTVPVPLAAICNKAMATNPEDRYASAGELQSDLTRYLDGYATIAENAHVGRLLQLVLARHRNLAIATAAFLAISLTLGVVFVQGLQRSRDVAERQRERAEELLFAVEEERSETLRLAGVVEDMRQLSARAAFLDRRFDDAAAVYAELARKYPNSLTIQQEKAVVHLVRQEFVASLQAFERANDPRTRPLASTARIFSRIKPDDTARLSPEDTVRFIKRIPPMRPGIRLRSFVFATRDASPEICLPIAAEMLPKIFALSAEFTKDGSHLRIDADDGYELGSVLWEADYPRAISVLTCLEPISIDLSHTQIRHIDDLRYLPKLQRVIMPPQRVSLVPFAECRQLVAITIPPNAYQPHHLATLSPDVLVTTDPKPYATPQD